MKVKPSIFKKALQETLKVYLLQKGQGEEGKEEQGEEEKEDPRVDWQKTGKYIFDEAEETDPAVDPEREPMGKYVFGDEDQETSTKLENDKINFNKDNEEDLEEAAPEGKGWEKIVKALKKTDVDNPFAVAHSMKSKGIKPKNEAKESKEEKSDFPLYDKKDDKDFIPEKDLTDKQQEDVYKWALGYVFMKRNGKK